jgi:type I restriction enzyme S subunit
MRDEYREHGIPFLRSQNVQPFRLDTRDVKYVDERFHGKLKKSALRAGDIVVVRTGYPGTAALVPDSLPNANCADLVVITTGPELDARFLVAVFNSAWGQSTVSGRLVGVAQQHFNVTVAKELRIPHPLIEEQRKVGAVLAAYDELIEINLRRIEILEQMAQAVYREWFVDFRVPGHGDGPLVDSALGPIPEGWCVGSYGDIAVETKSGVDPAAVDPETYYVGLEHIPQRSFTLIERASAATVTSRKWAFEPGDILFGRLRPYFHKVVEASFAGIASTDAIVIRPRPGWKDLALQIAFSKEFVDHAVSTSQGTDRPRAQWSDLAAFKFAIPDHQTNELFAATVRPMVDLAANLATEDENLHTTRDLLVPKLISGDIDVSALDIDTEWLA